MLHREAVDLTIAKSTTTPTVDAGTPIDYTVTVTNSQPGTATNVQVTDTLPTLPGIVWSETNPNCSISGGVNLELHVRVDRRE